MSAPIPVRGVGNKITRTDEYVEIEMFIPGATATGSFIMDAHVVDELRANMLIGTDNLEPQGIAIDFNTATAKIGACEKLTIPISIHVRGQAHAKRTSKAKATTTVSAKTTMRVPVAYKAMRSDRDFLFESECTQDLDAEGGVSAHLVYSSISFVLVHNATDLPVRLPRKARLGSIVEFEQEGAYIVTAEHAYLASGNTSAWKRKSWKSYVAKGLTVAAAAYAALTQPSSPATASIDS